MGTIKKFIGFVAATGQLDVNGKEYLAENDNPGSMLAIDSVLIIKDDNSTFTQEEVDFIIKELSPTLKISDDGDKPEN
jgi:hypothetical protein